jgi:hypothetical protein
VKYSIARYALLLLLVPLLFFGCDRVGPEDKWPVITYYEIQGNPNVTLEFVEGLGVPRFTIANRTVDLIVDVRSFNAGQEWTVTTFLEGVTRKYTNYEDNLPNGSYTSDIAATSIYRADHLTGEYQGGVPPQGTMRLTMRLYLDWFPETVDDWISYTIDPETGDFIIHWISDQFVYHFRMVVEDLEGRSDTISFDLYSILNIED